jgi:Carboxypeptidase regulatory-like domain
MDELGGLVVGARVTVTDAAGISKSVTTNDEGGYLFSRLAPGKYSVCVEASGFAPFESPDVEVKLRGSEPFNITLSVALEKQEVTVGTETGLNATAANNAGALRLSAAELDSLPDDPDDLSAALQAMAGPSAGPDGGQIIVDNFVDGRIPPKSSIREVRINMNPFSAEYNRLGFGRIEIFTKPGTNKFHGQAALNFSNQSLNSRNPFASTREPYRFFLYGGNLSGPVIKQKASFFLDFERRDINDNSIINATILDSTLNVTPFAQAVIVPQHRTALAPRFDYQLNQKNTVVARYTFLQQGQENAGIGNFSLLSRAFNSSYTEHTLQLTETAILNNRAINETRLQYSHQFNGQRGDDSKPSVNVLDAFVGGGSQVGRASNVLNRFDLQNYTTFVRGHHTLKAGASLRALHIKDILPMNFGGTYTFAGGSAPMLDANNNIVVGANGQPVIINITSIERYRRTLLFQGQGLNAAQIRALGGGATQFSISGGDADARVNQAEIGLFIQDEWTVRPNLNLSLGLRYDAQRNVHGYFNLAPRFAFGYAPKVDSTGKTKTVIRGGFGIFFDRVGETLELQANHFNSAAEQQFVSADSNVLDLFPVVPSPAMLATSSSAETTWRVASDLQLPFLIQGAISIERQLPFKFVFTATLLTTRGLHLLRSRNTNAPLPGTFQPNQPQASVRPLGNAAGDRLQYESSGRFQQNQLLVSLRNPLNSKMSVNVTYLLSKAKSDTDGADTFPANSYDLSGEYGRSALDARHRLNITGVFSLRHGFSLNPFILASSGRPFNITTGRDTNGDTLFTERPSFATDPNEPGVIATRFGLFNPIPRAGERLVPRNYGTSPSFFTLNLRASKTWGFGGERRAASASTQQAKQTAQKQKTNQASGSVGGGSMMPDTMRSSFFGNAPDSPYKLIFSIVARNIFNRTNKGRPIGNLNSLLFGQSNFLAPPFNFGDLSESNAANRRIELQIRFSF